MCLDIRESVLEAGIVHLSLDPQYLAKCLMHRGGHVKVFVLFLGINGYIIKFLIK